LGTLIALLCINTYADDLKVADDFKSGDLVSADTFNQIFDTIEKINRTVVDTDLVGVWSCNAMTSRNTSGWTSKGLFYILENAQVNLTASSASTSLESAYTISTSSPSPFKRTLTSAFSGTYVLYNNKQFTKQTDESEARIWDVNNISPTRFELTFLETSAQSFPTNYASFITCDSAEAVPASPTSPSASIDADNKRLTIAWTDASNDETGFKVYRKLSSETEYSLLTTLIGETSYADPNVTENLTAYYQITAYNDNGESAKSKTVSEIGDYTAPSVTSTSPAAASSVPQSDFSDPPAPGTLPVVFSFSEAVTTWPYCDPCTDTSLFSLTVNGTDSPSKLSAPAGVKLLGNSLQANLTYEAGATYVLTLSNEWIRDANGNVMKDDYSLTWTTP
jgi:hypothetical protein